MSIRPTQIALPAPPTLGPPGNARENPNTSTASGQIGASVVSDAAKLVTQVARPGSDIALQNATNIDPQASGATPPRPDELNAAVEKAQKIADAQAQELSFSVHDKTGTVVVKVIDRESKEVIRQIPAEEMLRLAERMQELEGKSEPGLLLRQEI